MSYQADPAPTPPEDTPVFSLDEPSDDAAHESIRVAVLAAIADLATNSAGVADAYFLTDLAFSLLDGLVNDQQSDTTDRGHLQQRIAVLEGQVADLSTRLAALENPPPPNPAP